MPPQKVYVAGQATVGRLSVASAAIEIDGKGYLTPLETVCRKYDLNGDGTFSLNEVKLIVSDMEGHKSAAKNAKRLALATLVASIVVIGLMFGLVYSGSSIANEASKESHIGGANKDSHTMVALDGQPAVTETPKSFSSILQFANFPAETLRELRSTSFIVNVGEPNATVVPADVAFKVADSMTFVQHAVPDDGTLERVAVITSPTGNALRISSQGMAIYTDGTMCSNGCPVLIGSSEREEFGGGNRRRLSMHDHRRRLTAAFASTSDWEEKRRLKAYASEDDMLDSWASTGEFSIPTEFNIDELGSMGVENTHYFDRAAVEKAVNGVDDDDIVVKTKNEDGEDVETNLLDNEHVKITHVPCDVMYSILGGYTQGYPGNLDSDSAGDWKGNSNNMVVDIDMFAGPSEHEAEIHFST